MAEGTVVALPYLYDLIVTERLATLQAEKRDEHTKGVVKRPERIHLGIETKPSAKSAYFISKARTQKKQTVAIDDGLL
jgi:hypothetical protein